VVGKVYGARGATGTRKPRVLLISPHFAEYTFELATALAARIDLRVGLDRANLANELSGAKRVALASMGDRLFQFKSSSFIGRCLAIISVLWHVVMFRPDLVHIQESGNKFVIWVGIALRRFLPIVLTVHDPLPHVGRDSAALRHWSQRLALRRVSALCFVHGTFCQAQMALPEAGGIAATWRIRHGPILQPTSGQIRVADPRRLLFFGRMEAYKGLDTLAAACEILDTHDRDYKLVLAGNGPELDRLATRFARCRHVEIMSGWLTPEDAIEQFQQAAFAVLPYVEATQSGVLAAIFANARGAIVSNVGGMPEIVEESGAGVIIPPNSPAALADAIEGLLLSEAKARDLGAKAIAYSQGSQSWAVTGDTTIAGYVQVSI